MRAAALAALLCACAVDTGTRDEAIVGGAVDDGDPAVVAIAGAPSACGAPLGASCTGALIAPRVVLTAAHCVVRPSPTRVIAIGATTDAPAEVHAIVSTHVHPGFDDATHTGDLALLVLDHAATPAPLAITAQAGTEATGDPVRVVGYGLAAIGGAPGVKRTGAAQVSTVSAGHFEITPAPAMTCTGDSGGPVLWTGVGGEVIAGVTSYGDAACAQFADNADVGGEHAWIDPIVAAAPSEPEAHGDGPIARDAICATACARDADCPAGFACTTDLSGDARCTAPGFTAGDFGPTCTTGAPCASGMCAAVPGGSCACFVACGDLPAAPAAGCGCRSSAGGGSAPVLIAVIFAGWTRRRSRRDSAIFPLSCSGRPTKV